MIKLRYCHAALFVAMFGVLLFTACSEDQNPYPVNNDPIPRIIELNPDNVSVGDELAIVGVNFSENEGENEVRLNQMVVEPFYVSDTLIKVVVPEVDANVLAVTVRSRGKISNRRNLLLVNVAVFGDDFNRDDVPPSGPEDTPNPLGDDWQVMAGTFELKNNSLFSALGGVESYAIFRHPELDMKTGGGSNFVLRADFSASSGSFAGVVFNVQDDGKRFYLVRINGALVQVLKAGHDGPGDWVNVMMTEDIEGFDSSVHYQVEISASRPGNFLVKIRNLEANSILFERNFEDGDPYLGGVPGFYYFGLAAPVAITFDNLSVETM